MSHKNGETKSNAAEHVPLDANIAAPPRRKTFWEGIKEIYYEYCSNTSLHGVQYLGQRRPWKEICFWLCIFVLAVYFCSQTISQVYDKWNTTPVIVSFSEQSLPISNIPFPAITICPETRRRLRADGPSYKNLERAIGENNELPANLTTTELEEFLTLLHICDSGVSAKQLSRLSNETIDYNRVLHEMSLGLEEHVGSCKWFGIEDTCEDLLTPTDTGSGLCYTFNGYNATDLYRENTVQYQQSLERFVNVSSTGRINRTLTWSLEQGYAKNEPLKTYPARVLSANNKAAFVAFLQIDAEHIDYGCSLTQGYKILVHTPDDVPLLTRHFVRLSPKIEVTITAKPIMVTTSDGIAKYPAKKRKCFMNSERHLQFFKVYSEKNCEMECLTNYTLAECGCVKFSMPRTVDLPVCAEDKIACYTRAEEKMPQDHFNNGDDCNCMPSCTSLEYDAEISQADYDIERTLDAQNFDLDGWDGSFSQLIVHFRDNEFIPSKRSELYGFTDFLANCGGVFGLFMGFSILSLVEWLYHITLRLWSNMTSKKYM